MITTGKNVGLAEGIFDDTCLVTNYFFQGLDWSFQTELPDWAKDGWVAQDDC